MERQFKSFRNQLEHERKRAERKLRARNRAGLPVPRFGPGVEIPEIPEGMELHKFFGQPAFLPVRLDGEPLVGRTPYTQRMLDRLSELVDQRNYELFIRPEEDAITRLGGYLGLI